MGDLTEDEWFALTVKSLRELADQIELRRIRPVSLENTRDYERVENERGETTDFKPGNFKLILGYESVIPKEVLDGG